MNTVVSSILRFLCRLVLVYIEPYTMRMIYLEITIKIVNIITQNFHFE